MSRSSVLTRQRILEAASEEFRAHGFQEASVRRIANVANATTGATYRLFPGLDDSPADELFLRTVAASGVEALRKAVEHDLSREEARKYMNRTREFRLNGWTGLAAA